MYVSVVRAAGHAGLGRVLLAAALAVAPVGNLLAMPAAAVAITIDGSFDDWTSSASFDDASTDAGGGSTELTRVWTTADGTNIYIRWDSTLPANKDKITSDAFSATLDTTGGSTANARIWVTFNASGVATTELERPLGTFVTIGAAQQRCAVIVCSAGAASSIEASMTLASLGVTSGSIVSLQAETRASAAHNASVKDCVPGGAACSGAFLVNTATGEAAVSGGHPTIAVVTCATATPTVGVATICTVTVRDTSLLGASNPTGLVTFSAATGSFTGSTCTLAAVGGSIPPRSTCTTSFTASVAGAVII